MTTTPASNPYSEAQAAKAVAALKAHLATQKATSKPSLFDDADESDLEDGTVGVADPDLALWLIITGKKFFSKDNKKTKQQRIVLPKPYLTTPSPTFTVCVITKDPSTYYRSLLPHLPYHPTSLTIISPSKLRTHYKSFESRRQLERSHDLFLADDRVIPTLPALLGKSIYRRSSKVPIPIKLSKIEPAENAAKAKLQEDAEKLQKEIERAIRATYFLLAASATLTIKVGIRAQSPEDVAKNVTAVLEHLTSNDVVKGGWNGMRAVHIKAAETVSLPIWLTERIYDDEDVLKDEEVKRIEYLKTKEGREEHKKEIKEARKERKTQREERRKNRRHWDSDAESGEDQEFVSKPKKATAGVKRKADGAIEEPGSAKKARVEEKKVEKATGGDEDDEEEGGVKLPEPVDLSEQAKRLKIGDKRIAPPAPALETKKGKKHGNSKTAKDKLKRKASKTDLPATKGKKSKAYQ
ncbi:hypothetical protein TWF696_006843 [Orbilia brochopaga]|uniref:Ribosomal protein L1 n=1 Tax=Orbilia brochopaga TaxID=3140254 RepID=A0AAV9UWA4_9PEZI